MRKKISNKSMQALLAATIASMMLISGLVYISVSKEPEMTDYLELMSPEEKAKGLKKPEMVTVRMVHEVARDVALNHGISPTKENLAKIARERFQTDLLFLLTLRAEDPALYRKTLKFFNDRNLKLGYDRYQIYRSSIK